MSKLSDANKAKKAMGKELLEEDWEDDEDEDDTTESPIADKFSVIVDGLQMCGTIYELEKFMIDKGAFEDEDILRFSIEEDKCTKKELRQLAIYRDLYIATTKYQEFVDIVAKLGCDLSILDDMLQKEDKKRENVVFEDGVTKVNGIM